MLVSTLTSLREIKFDFDHALDFHPNPALEKAVFKTLAYFDIFNYPLTAWEVYRYLYIKDLNKEVGFLETKNILDNNFQNKEGFYFLANRQNLVEIRKERQVISAKKYKKARRVIRLLSLLPFIKMIAVSNSLAYDNAKEESDVDLFIISKSNKIWTARFYATVVLKLLHRRPTPNITKDKICLNFFATTESLNLENLQIQNDIYFKYWLLQLTPIYDGQNYFNKLIKQNDWLTDFVNINYHCSASKKRKIKNNLIIRAIKFVLEKINSFNFIENFLKAFQFNRMPKNIKQKMNKGTTVVVNDRTLKFHLDDRREEFRDKWLNQYE